MALIGDVLITAREQFPDRPATLGAPTGFSSAQFGGTPTIALGSYLISITLFTAWGETLATSLSAITVDGTHGLQVTGVLPVGATKIRVYYGITTINQYQDFTTTPAQILTPGIAGAAPGSAGGTPINRAYLPDSDGAFISAATLYRWFNQGLDAAAEASGGIQDYSGISSVVGVGLYQVPIVGWKKITNVWYDGYDVFSGRKRDIYRRTQIVGYSGMSVAVTLTPNTIIEAFPQPQRTAGTFNLNANLSTTATSVAITAGNFVLTPALAQITQGANAEIVYFSSLSNLTMSGMTRGLGGTVPTAFTTGATVSELNFMLAGFRRAVYANVGDSTKTLQVPPAWLRLLPIYIVAQFRRVEKEFREADQMFKQFEQEVKAEAASNKQLSGPVQIGENRSLEVYGGGLGGGWLIQ
jgi:hypothetical protein